MTEQRSSGTICNQFFWKDTEASIKTFKFLSDHPNASQDVITVDSRLDYERKNTTQSEDDIKNEINSLKV